MMEMAAAAWDSWYRGTIRELDALMDLAPDAGSPGAARLLALAVALQAYEDIRWPIPRGPMADPLLRKVLDYDVRLIPAEEGGFTVEVPSLPGCISQGDTEEEALANIREAIELYLEDGKTRG